MTSTSQISQPPNSTIPAASDTKVRYRLVLFSQPKEVTKPQAVAEAVLKATSENHTQAPSKNITKSAQVIMTSTSSSSSTATTSSTTTVPASSSAQQPNAMPPPSEDLSIDPEILQWADEIENIAAPFFSN